MPSSAICQENSNLVHMGDAPPADRGLRCPVAGKESEAVEGERPPREARRARMRKMGLMLALMAVGLLVASGAALAAIINCAGDCSGTNDPDRLIGSNASQTMLGLDG